MNGVAASPTQLYLLSAATPTICAQGPVAPCSRIRLPIGSWPGQ